MSGTCNASLHIGGVQCMHCMQSPTGRKPTISLRLPRSLLEEIDELVRRTRMRSRTEFLERAVESYVDELREARGVRPKDRPGVRHHGDRRASGPAGVHLGGSRPLLCRQANPPPLTRVILA